MSKQKVQVDGRTAYVSGAASGIGRAVALRLAAHGCPVAIVDQNEDGLRETAELIAGPVLARTLDVRDRQAQMAFAAEVADWAPTPVGMVLNNAGVATSQSVAEGSLEDDEWVLDINLGGVINGTRAFLPILLRQDSGVIVNTSSVFGLVGIPFQSAYCTSKFAVRGFTESLRHELRGTGVHAVTVHPGGVKTNIARNARYPCSPVAPRPLPRGGGQAVRVDRLHHPRARGQDHPRGGQGRPHPDPRRPRRLHVRRAGAPGAHALLRRPGVAGRAGGAPRVTRQRARTARQETLSVPTMPPARWPGTLQ